MWWKTAAFAILFAAAAQATTNTTEAPQHPQDVNATYQGTWHQSAEPEIPSIALLQHHCGVVIFPLRIAHDSGNGVQDVEGQVALRSSQHVHADDLVFRLTGIYIPETGQLHAQLEPSTPIIVEVNEQDVQQNTQSYRQALRTVANDISAAQQSDGKLQLEKECQFQLQLNISTVPQNNTEQQDERDIVHTGGMLGGARRSLLRQMPSDSNVDPPTSSLYIANGTLTSPNCNVELRVDAASINLDKYYAKAINYTLMITAISLAQVLLVIRQMESTVTPATLSKVSMLTIGHQAIFDAYLCLVHLTIGIYVQHLFNAFATAAFFEFCIFAIFEMRYLLSIWRSRRGSVDVWTAQRELSALYARFYGVLLGGMMLTFNLLRYMQLLLFPLYSFWLPQIILCLKEDCRQPLQPLYVLSMSITRLALPLYVYGCPANITRVAPHPWLCLALTAYVGLQAALLLLQFKFGARCFVPKFMLPPKYDYHRVVEGDTGDVETGNAAKECVICMNAADVSDPKARMVTPCGHYFHVPCLQRWMDIKLECPTCRRPLPPL